jgi:aspartate aminotransferase
VLALTVPDDPTGTVAPPELLHEVCEAARDLDLLVVSDESLRDLPHHLEAVPVSPAEMLPERTVVVGGPGPSLALSGWRLAFARFPGERERLRDRAVDVADALGLHAPAPVQEVAAYALSEPADLRAHVAASARLHGAVTAELCRLAREAAGALCRPPQAGYTLYVDFAPAGDLLARHGVDGSAALERHLRERYRLGVLGGHRFGDDPEALRCRLSAGGLYGASTEARWAALRASEPLRVPHVAEALAALDLVFTELTRR